MIEGWSWRHARRVRRRVRRLRHSNSPSPAGRLDEDLARSTGFLAMYSDLGGSILLSPSGEVFFLDHEFGSVGRLHDPSWTKTALVRLAEKYPDLADLRPRRPDAAVDCEACRGLGRVLAWNALCGECTGTGWLSG